MDAAAKKRHIRTVKVLTPIVRPVLYRLLNYHEEPIPKMDGPVLVLCNHNTDLDCILVTLSFGRQIYFVATETVTRIPVLGKLVMRYFTPILHKKGVQGTATIRGIIDHIKEGDSVALFPEGNRSFNGQTCPIPPATAKLARMSKATLVTYKLTGGYFTSPRWGRGLRRGRMEGHVMGIYPMEKLKEMSVQEVREAIEKDLWTDAYEEQQPAPVSFRSRKRANYLEALLFACPRCKKIGTLRSKRAHLTCSCGLDVTYTEDGRIQDGDTLYSLTELDRKQQEYLKELAERDGCLFSDRVHLQKIGKDHEILSDQEYMFSACRDRFLLDQTPLPLDEIEAVSIVQRNRLLIYTAGSEDHYEITGAKNFNALKYFYLFRLIRPSVNGTL